MKRLFDITLSLILFIPSILICLLSSLFVFIVSPGPVIHWSKRVGKNNDNFMMPKLRTMKLETPQVATHLLKPADYLIPFGSLIRKLSLDEIPQIWSILKGDMSFVGPRPALFNQDDLVEQRTQKGVHELVPGVTGWAQINGRDEISIPEKVELDFEYKNRQSLIFDIKIIAMTFGKVLSSKDVSH
jgi:O-antigen biosynthesis protein WbqP